MKSYINIHVGIASVLGLHVLYQEYSYLLLIIIIWNCKLSFF